MTEAFKAGRPMEQAPRDVSAEVQAKRDEFLQTFFKRGAEVTDELLQENERLREAVSALEAHNTELRHQLASDSAMRELLGKITFLEREKDQLLTLKRKVEADSQTREHRFADVEDELSMLANVYVASYQLSSTLRLKRVFEHIHELLGQLVGSRAHAIYLGDEEKRRLVCVGSEGVTEDRRKADLTLGEAIHGDVTTAIIERTYLTGVPYFRSSPPPPDDNGPAACVALRVDNQVVGAVVVYELLDQKPELLQVDRELFKVLEAHAATAMYGAQLYERANQALPHPDDFAVRLHRPDPTKASR